MLAGTSRMPVWSTAWIAAQLLGQLLHQDVARPRAGVTLKQGVSRDRIVTVDDL